MVCKDFSDVEIISHYTFNTFFSMSLTMLICKTKENVGFRNEYKK